MFTELKEVLLPFNAKELEYFNEATTNCTNEQRLAVAKRMSEEKPPHGYQFTESQIKRFVTQESVSKLNWYPNIEIENGGAKLTEAEQDAAKVVEFQERQFKTYRASGMSESEASAMSGFKPKKA